MKAIKLIFLRELHSYFDSTIAYIFLVVFLLINCSLYMVSFFYIEKAEMRIFFDLLPMVLVVFIPAITMRQWAEEKKLGTMELLMTLPVETYKIVIGKYLAGFTFFLLALVGTWTIPVTLSFLGNPDFGPIWGGYIGSAIVGGLYLSIGIFASGLCRDQILAFILGFTLCCFFYVSGSDIIASQIDGWTGSFMAGTKLKNYISLTRHFEGIERGLIDIKNIIYFISMTILFLMLNIRFLEARREPGSKKRSVTAIVVFSGIAIFTNVVAAGFSWGRFDVTEEKIFTVSDASKDILRQLKAPITLRFYVTPREKMPTEMKNIERDVIDKLEELRITSGNRLTYKVADPLNSPESEEMARKKGILPFPIQSLEKDEIAVKFVYSSIAISYLDKPEWVINSIHFKNLHNLEYELISKIYRLSLNKIPTIALYAPAEIINPQSPTMDKRPPRVIDRYSKLEKILQREGYKVMRINLDAESTVPDNADTLIIMRPRKLNERQRYEISRFLVNGGNVVLAVQNYTFHYFSSGRGGIQIMPAALSPHINTLIKKYGLTVDDSIFMDTQQDILELPTGSQVRGLSTSPKNISVFFPVQIKVTPDNINREAPITNRITSLLYLWGSRLILHDDLLQRQHLKARILVWSSRESWTIPYKEMSPLTKADMTPKVNRFGKRLPLAVIVEGIFPDVFKEKNIPLWPDKKTHLSQPEEKKSVQHLNPSSAKMVVIGNGEMFANRFLAALDNGIFLLNIIDSLSLKDEIITIRSKRQTERLIRKTSSYEKLWYRFFVILISPILIVLAGILRFLLRQREKMNYTRMLNLGANAHE